MRFGRYQQCSSPTTRHPSTSSPHYNMLQHTATHCNTHCNATHAAMQRTLQCTMQHTLQHTRAQRIQTLFTPVPRDLPTTRHPSTNKCRVPLCVFTATPLKRPATNCNTLLFGNEYIPIKKDLTFFFGKRIL